MSTPDPDTFSIYAWGLMHASVCSVFSKEETTRLLNQEMPTGLDHGWEPDPRGTFGDNVTPNPSPCNQYPDTHTHYLFTC